MWVCVHTRVLLLILISPLRYRYPLSVFTPYFQFGGGRTRHYLSQNLPCLLLYLSIILHLLSVCHFLLYMSMSMSLYLFCCMFLWGMLLPPRVGWYTQPEPYSLPPPKCSILKYQRHLHPSSPLFTYLHCS